MSDVHACMHKQTRTRGACSPRKFLQIRSSEIASEAILGQSRSRYMDRRVLHPVLTVLSMYGHLVDSKSIAKIMKMGRQ